MIVLPPPPPLSPPLPPPPASDSFFIFETEFPVDQDGLELFNVTEGDLELPVVPLLPPSHSPP